MTVRKERLIAVDIAAGHAGASRGKQFATAMMGSLLPLQ